MAVAIRTNRAYIIEQSVLGMVASPLSRKGWHWRVGADGRPSALPGTGGISYNCRVGDSALQWEADHVEPCVSLKNENEDANAGLNFLACVGNSARVVSGDAKGDTGVVTGKHGGIEHVLVDFADSSLEKLVIGDKVQVRARGLGLKLLDFPEIELRNLDPDFLEKMAPEPDGDCLKVRVTHTIPGAVMGSGLGAADTFSGDYDVQMFDPSVDEQFGLNSLRLGDIVAVVDADHTYGRIYLKGAMSIGIIVHTRCVQAGHGPGVTTLMTSTNGKIVPVVDANANIADYLGIGRRRAEYQQEQQSG